MSIVVHRHGKLNFGIRHVRDVCINQSGEKVWAFDSRGNGVFLRDEKVVARFSGAPAANGMLLDDVLCLAGGTVLASVRIDDAGASYALHDLVASLEVVCVSRASSSSALIWAQGSDLQWYLEELRVGTADLELVDVAKFPENLGEQWSFASVQGAGVPVLSCDDAGFAVFAVMRHESSYVVRKVVVPAEMRASPPTAFYLSRDLGIAVFAVERTMYSCSVASVGDDSVVLAKLDSIALSNVVLSVFCLDRELVLVRESGHVLHIRLDQDGKFVGSVESLDIPEIRNRYACSTVFFYNEENRATFGMCEEDDLDDWSYVVLS